MAGQSILHEVLPKLGANIEERTDEWAAQSADCWAPALSSTKAGKVNVRELALALGLNRNQEQHFFKHVELRAAVNAAAAPQRLAQIGSREETDANDVAVGKLIEKTSA